MSQNNRNRKSNVGRTQRGRGGKRRYNNKHNKHRQNSQRNQQTPASSPPGLSSQPLSQPKIGLHERRQIYAFTRCVGSRCEVQMTDNNNATIGGIFDTAFVGGKSPPPQPISLRMAYDLKTEEFKSERTVLKGQSWVQMRIPGLNLLEEMKVSTKNNSFGTDAEISGRTQVQERTLQSASDWVSGSHLIDGLEDPMAETDGPIEEWDQFEANKDLRRNNVIYDENTMAEFYTTKLTSNTISKDEADRIAKEIERKKAARPVDDRDDEDRYSAVIRPKTVPDIQQSETLSAKPESNKSNFSDDEVQKKVDTDSVESAARHKAARNAATRKAFKQFQEERPDLEKDDVESPETDANTEESNPPTQKPDKEKEKEKEEPVLNANAPTFKFNAQAPSFVPTQPNPNPSQNQMYQHQQQQMYQQRLAQHHFYQQQQLQFQHPGHYPPQLHYRR